MPLQRQPQAPQVIALMPGGKLRWHFLFPISNKTVHSAAGKTDYTITHRKSLISECRSVFCHSRLGKELPLTSLFWWGNFLEVFPGRQKWRDVEKSMPASCLEQVALLGNTMAHFPLWTFRMTTLIMLISILELWRSHKCRRFNHPHKFILRRESITSITPH